MTKTICKFCCIFWVALYFGCAPAVNIKIAEMQTKGISSMRAYPDAEAWKTDRTEFIKTLESIKNELENKTKTPRIWYRGLSITGLVLGGAGGVITNNNATRFLSASTGVLTGILGLLNLGAKTQQREGIVEYIDGAIAYFKLEWIETNYPNTPEKQKKYEDRKENIVNGLSRLWGQQKTMEEDKQP